MTELSVKGLTWGSPEFVKISKLGERQGEANGIVDGIVDAVDSLVDHGGFKSDSGEQHWKLHHVRDDLTDMLVLYDEE